MTPEPVSPAGGAPDRLGAHVSAAGGVHNAPARAAALGASVLQLFTKQPSRWAEPIVDDDLASAFLAERRRHGVGVAASHDSYLINLASPDQALRRRSCASFKAELERCEALGLGLLVTHPGNATDGDRASGLARNADGLAEALESRAAGVSVLLETTAGSGHALGSTFEELGELRERLPPGARQRVGVCVDSCHVWAAGYDLLGDFAGVLGRLDDHVGLEHVRLVHLNDSLAPRGSRRDRHAHIGEGTLGPEPFRRLVTDPRLAPVPKVIETPKDGNAFAADLRNLRRLRSYLLESGGRAPRPENSLEITQEGPRDRPDNGTE